MEIDKRNRLRVEAGLPLLDVPAEKARLKNAKEDAEFEKFFQLRRDEFRHLVGSSRGFLTNMGIYSTVRKALREERQAQARS